MNTSPVSNVSDTARWVAVYRAWESARPDALFNDPYAQTLAGERGQAIAALMPAQARSGWPMIARTKLIDDSVQAAVAQDCDCVINLAAGLDTRPYRLDLPRSLRWIEVDLPALTEEKERLLADAQPRCQLRRIKADLTVKEARAAALHEALGPSSQALVLTEGLLGYLDDAQVGELSRDLAAQAAVRNWILDLGSPAILQMMRQGMGATLQNAPLKFAPETALPFLKRSAGALHRWIPFFTPLCVFGGCRCFSSSSHCSRSPIPGSWAEHVGQAWCGLRRPTRPLHGIQRTVAGRGRILGYL